MDPVVNIDRCYFSWSVKKRSSIQSDADRAFNSTLLDIQLAFPKVSHNNPLIGQLKLALTQMCCCQGKLIGVIGKVGSGKSSLLSAILGEMHKDIGYIEVTCSTEVRFI